MPGTGRASQADSKVGVNDVFVLSLSFVCGPLPRREETLKSPHSRVTQPLFASVDADPLTSRTSLTVKNGLKFLDEEVSEEA